MAVEAEAPTEHRLVSVLFCDLVGFTPLSEGKDPEDVRELLSGYFELARKVIGRYGGVVEKFIGDAVMAVWGAPLSREDDAERAVRAGLDLIAAVRDYGSERASEEAKENGAGLSCRVGVTTGEVATMPVKGEGLVTGEKVNTAARIQTAAPPGCLYVDSETKALTSASISYVEKGPHELKGMSSPVELYEAKRVIAAVGGASRHGGIEAPFVGRDPEFRLLRELFHTNTERGQARMVIVSGVAGIGKSRLSWELLKYLDGLAGQVLYHSGRCLSYGEGVSFWALSEIVRSRLQIGEADREDVVRERLRAGLERWIEDPADREVIGPRLGQLLGLTPDKSLSKEELFVGWRLFFERLSEHLPVFMVIEDLQWADRGLLEFLDHLLEWSGRYPIFLLVLTRPEGTEERGLRLSRRNVTSLSLDPLPDEVMGELLDGLVTGLPKDARDRIVAAAEGIPLYAVETVRALLDKGQLKPRADGLFELEGDLGELRTPPGLTALISSRLDGLSEPERSLVKKASVLGMSFPKEAIGAVSGLDEPELLGLLSSLVRKEVLGVRADRHSPEVGQYAFTQSLIRFVSHDMLSRQEKRDGHLKVASYLEAAFPDEGAEVIEVIASHLDEALKASGEDDPALKERAREANRRAGERSSTTGAKEASMASFLRAAALSDDEREKAELFEKAGDAARDGGYYTASIPHLEASMALHNKAGRAIDVAAVTEKLGYSLGAAGKMDEAVELLTGALSSLGDDTPPEIRARLKLRLGGALVLSGRPDPGLIESALLLAQDHDLEDVLAEGLVAQGLSLAHAGRHREACSYFESALDAARRAGVRRVQHQALVNLGDIYMTYDLPGGEGFCKEALSLSKDAGARSSESFAAGNLIYILLLAGRFLDCRALARELFEEGGLDRPFGEVLHYMLGQLEALTGNAEEAASHLEAMARWEEAKDVQSRACYDALSASLLLLRGEHQKAALLSTRVLDEPGIHITHEAKRAAFPVAVEALVDGSDLDGARSLLGRFSDLPKGRVPPFTKAHLARGEGLFAKASGEKEAATIGLKEAIEIFEKLSYPYWETRTELELAEHLFSTGEHNEARRLAKGAEETLSRLGAASLAERAGALVREATRAGAGPSDKQSPAVTGRPGEGV